MTPLLIYGFVALLFGVPLTTAYVDDLCYEQHEAYLRCVSRSQDRPLCERKEISWYCVEEKK